MRWNITMNIQPATGDCPEKPERSLFPVIIATGITSVAAQVAVLREFLTVFNGNEFTVSIILFSWLACGGAGTLLAAVTGPVFRGDKIKSLIRLSGAAGTLSVAQVLIIRKLFTLVYIPGLSHGFYSSFFFILAAIAPLAILIGFLLPFSFQVIRERNPGMEGPRIYLADAIGDAMGGLVFTFVLIRYFSPVQAVFAAACTLVASLILPALKSGYFKTCLGTALVFFLVGLACIRIEPLTLTVPGGQVVQSQETEYGRVMVARTGSEYTFYSDGIPLFSTSNAIMAEETAHYPLCQRSRINRVLSIATVSGLFPEIAKHAPQAIDYVELDPGVSDALTRFGFVRQVPGLTTINTDAIQFIHQTSHVYSAVLVSLPPPDTFQLNRFYTLEFFTSVKSILEHQGMVSLSLPPLPMFITDAQKQILSTLHATLKQVFQEVLFIPGEQTVIIASDMPLSLDIPGLLAEKGITTLFAGPGFRGTVSPMRLEDLAQAISAKGSINRDYSPTLVIDVFKHWFETFDTDMTWFIVTVAAVFTGYLLWAGPMERVLFTTGATLMGMESLVILVYQIAFGNLYTRIGLVVSVFLVGLIPGAWLGIRFLRRYPHLSMGPVLAAEGFICALTLLFPILLTLGSPGEMVLLGYGLILSGVCAFQAAMVFNTYKDTSQSVIRVISSDLIGASIAPLLFTLVMVPFFGIVWTGGMICLLKTINLTIAVYYGKAVKT